MLTLRRAPSRVVEVLDLDDVQRAAVAHRGGVARVLGAPGTGKTTTAIEIVLDRVRRDGLAADRCLVISASRTAAGELRQRVTSRLGGTSTEPLARTMQAFGFGVLRQAAALAGEPPPRLLSGPEQDVILRELLGGHAAGEVAGPVWPEHVQAALTTRGFRTELRDLLMRAVERGVEPKGLALLGRRHDRPEWVAAAEILREYDEVTALSRPGAYDPAWILGAAADLLEDDEAALRRLHERLRLVVVDDAQELTSAAARLLQVATGARLDLVLIGDPDAAVQTFRGADPRVLGASWGRLGAGPTFTLATAYRQPQVLHDVTRRVTRRIGAVGGGSHRAATPVRAGGRVEVRLLRATSQEAALVAAELRQAHLADGLAWSEMAVVVRGQGRTSTLRRVLMASGVPVAVPSADVAVRDEVAVRPLLGLLDMALRAAWGEPDAVTPQEAVDVISSPIGGADAVALRRLRRALRRDELAAGGGRTSDELLADALLQPAALAHAGIEAFPARRVARALAAGIAAARMTTEDGTRRWAPGVTAESVLWAIWDATGLADGWRRAALGTGPGSARADRDLDAVVALFGAAAAYVDRLPQAGPREFLEHVRGQDVPGDTLVARSPSDDAVSLLTPQGAAGRQWRFVVVAGVQEGVWPDLRLRGSLLGSERLVDLLTGRGTSFRAAQAAVRYDETRLFLVAVSRASERLLVTAVRSDDEQPSVYLDIVDPPAEADDSDELRDFAEVPRPMALPALVAELRREVADPAIGPEARRVAARALARLAAERVPGADPASWWAQTPPSDERSLRPAGVPVAVSPSRIESFGDCNLRWLLTACGGDGPSIGAANIGTLIHDLAAELGDVDEATMRAEVEARWGRLGLPQGWRSRRLLAEAQAMVTRLARYVAESRAQGWQLVGVEVDLSVELGMALLRGRVDRLERSPDGGLRVVDLKTGSGKPTAAELPRHAQLGAYQSAVVHGAFEHGSASAGAALLQLGKAAGVKTTLQEQPPLSADDEPGWADELIEQTAQAMASNSFTATVGPGCTFCSVRSSCPVQPEGRVI